MDLANAAGLIVSRCEAAAFHRSLGADRHAYWDEVRDQLDAADRVPATDYLDAQLAAGGAGNRPAGGVRALRRVVPAHRRRGAAASSTTSPGSSPRLVPSMHPLGLAGFPAVSVPCGFDSGGFPVGLQIVGPPGADALVVAVAAQVEQALGPYDQFASMSGGVPALDVSQRTWIDPRQALGTLNATCPRCPPPPPPSWGPSRPPHVMARGTAARLAGQEDRQPRSTVGLVTVTFKATAPTPINRHPVGSGGEVIEVRVPRHRPGRPAHVRAGVKVTGRGRGVYVPGGGVPLWAAYHPWMSATT